MKLQGKVVTFIVLMSMGRFATAQNIPPTSFAVVDPNSIRNGNTGYSTLIDELGNNQISETLTLNFGQNQYTFKVNSGKLHDVKTFRIVNSGIINYSAASTAIYKDNQQHMLSGSGSLNLDKAKNYRIMIYQDVNNRNIRLEAIDIAAEGNRAVMPPRTGDRRFGGVAPQNIQAYLRYGQKPVSLLLLDNALNEKFYIYADGVIQVYNMDRMSLGICGQKAAPFYGPWNGRTWAWAFYRGIGNGKQETYHVSTSGEVWSAAQDGTFHQYGYVTGCDF